MTALRRIEEFDDRRQGLHRQRPDHPPIIPLTPQLHPGRAMAALPRHAMLRPAEGNGPQHWQAGLQLKELRGDMRQYISFVE